jgi:hypothetical protein
MVPAHTDGRFSFKKHDFDAKERHITGGQGMRRKCLHQKGRKVRLSNMRTDDEVV